MTRVAPYILIGIIALMIFLHSLGRVALFDWDEINFAESAREMIETGNYMRVQINYEPFWEKPPLFFWMQAGAMHLFGINEWAARLPNAVCGVITLLILYSIGKRLHNEIFARWWVLIYAGSFLPHLYFKSGIIDPWFNLFIFLGIYFLFLFLNESSSASRKQLLLSAVFTGLAILTKGPVGLLIVVLSYLTFYFLSGRQYPFALRYLIIWLSVTGLVALIWFGLEILQHGWWFAGEFFRYQIRLAQTKDAGHGGFFLYHFVVLLIGCFPASWFIFKKADASGDRTNMFRKWMLAALAVILIVFTLVRTKIVHYSSFAYFPIGYLATVNIYNLLTQKNRMKGWQRWGLLVTGLIWALLFTALPVLGAHPEWLKVLLKKDAFALANLEAEVSWEPILILPGILYAGTVVYSFISFKAHRYKKGILTLFLASLVSIQIILTFFVPKIEQYSQEAALEFYRSLKGKDVYVRSLGFKSYAPYFYSGVRPGLRPESKDIEWLLKGAVDKPAYFVSKITRKEKILDEHGSRLKILYEKNGFVFYQRR
jgi:4-amino-4-deoxy-L-arabinose transferase-like glycosyltransferase